MDLSKFIDHTILKPDCSLNDIKKVVDEAIQFGFAAVCIPPYYVKSAAELLEDKDVKVATVIGFPMGYSTTSAKVEEIKRAINDGADELDVVINLSAVRSDDWNYVSNDIEDMTRAVHLKGKKIKVIIETGLLSDNQIIKVCQICEKFGVNFVKTSTGFHGTGATVEAVQLMRKTLSPKISIKASGGIRTPEFAQDLITAGASRLGTSKSVDIVS